MTAQEAMTEFNRILNYMVKMRDRYGIYSDDWATLPNAVKSGVKSRFATVTAQASTDLAALNAEIQAQ